MKISNTSKKDTLIVTTAIEETWGTDEDLIFLGEWCKRYQAKALWSSRQYKTAPYHWRDRKKLAKDHEYLKQLYDKLIDCITIDLNHFHNKSYPARFWRILIGPWLLNFVSVIWDRWEVISELEQNELSSFTYLFDGVDRSPSKDYLDSVYNYSSDFWNHTVFRDIFLFRRLPNISLNFIPSDDSIKDINLNHPMETSIIFNDSINIQLGKSKTFTQNIKKLLPFKFFKTIFSILKKSLIKAFHLFFLAFTKIDREFLIFHSYFSRPFLMKLFFALRILPAPDELFNKQIDYPSIHSRDLRWFKSFKAKNDFEKFLSIQIEKDIPIAYLEGYLKILQVEKFLPNSKIIFTANAHFHNEIFKLWSAKNAIERNAQLIISAHGGALYPLYSVFDHQEKIADKRVIWGKPWTSNQITLPPNKLSYKIKKYNSTGTVLFIEYDLQRYTHRAVAMPFGPLLVESIDINFQFINSLSPEVRESFKVRPKYQGQHCIHQRYYDRFGKSIFSQNNSLLEQIGESRLVISTYPQTAFSESIFSGVPTMLFYKEEYFEVQPIYDELISLMKECNIIHTHPAKAAEHVNSIYNNPMEWWESSATIKARELFYDLCMSSSSNPYAAWVNFFNEQKK
jgi:putative transferase (TIGR04331 family)